PAPVQNSVNMGSAVRGNPSNPANVSGAVTDVAVDRTDPTNNTIYIATAAGGAWKTIDGGQTWQALTDNFPGSAVQTTFAGSIALDPRNPQVVYLGTGSLNGGSAGHGVWESTDAGRTWRHL